MLDYKLIKVATSPGRTDIVLNSPPLSILNIAMMEEICSALAQAAQDKSLRVLIFRSEGKHFSAGADVAEHTSQNVEAMIPAFGRMFKCLSQVEAVTIAAVEGSALGGGCELACYCDIVLASDRAKFGQPEIQIGVFPPVAAVILPRLIGRARALELITTGRLLKADEALAWGLVNHVWPTEEFPARVEEFLNSLTSLSAAALALAKKALDQGLDLTLEQHLELADKIYLKELMATHDANEGLAAFLEKRKAVWENR